MLTQEQRHNMIESFKATNGEETAMALAESLFSNDLATKTDLNSVKSELKGDFRELEGKFDKLVDKMDWQFRWLMGAILGSYGAIVAALGIGIAVVLRVS